MNRYLLSTIVTVFSICLATASDADEAKQKTRSKPQPPPKLARLPKAVPAPKDNPTTPAKVELGRLLFFDTRLSGDNKTSCATCHAPKKAYGDGLPRAKGVDGKPLPRNSQTLLNVGFLKSFFWDGRAATLEEQALAPIESRIEMNQDLEELVRELRAIDDYERRFKQVFGRSVNKRDIARALAAFQRTLVTTSSPFDRYLAGDKKALSRRARQGLELFRGEAGCIRCHNGPLLSDGKYYRLRPGVPDKGRAAVTKKREDTSRFRTPPLRDIAQTGPYMHDGSQATLFDVVQFYFRGVPQGAVHGLKAEVESLDGVSFSDIEAVVEFLKSLSGKPPTVTLPGINPTVTRPGQDQDRHDPNRKSRS